MLPAACSKRLLIVDDDPAIRRLVRVLLERSHGCHVDDAPGAQEAITYLTEHTYDAIVLDLMMPQGNGVDVLNFLDEQRITVPCIVISATAQRVLDEITAPNIVAKLRKPFEIDELVAATGRSLAAEP